MPLQHNHARSSRPTLHLRFRNLKFMQIIAKNWFPASHTKHTGSHNKYQPNNAVVGHICWLLWIINCVGGGRKQGFWLVMIVVHIITTVLQGVNINIRGILMESERKQNSTRNGVESSGNGKHSLVRSCCRRVGGVILHYNIQYIIRSVPRRQYNVTPW